VACRAGEGLIRELFEPLGYSVVAQQHPLDEKLPEWGEGPYYSVTFGWDVPFTGSPQSSLCPGAGARRRKALLDRPRLG
jgi:RNA repair, ligase-Pnkp-associating, region of Hen1